MGQLGKGRCLWAVKEPPCQHQVVLFSVSLICEDGLVVIDNDRNRFDCVRSAESGGSEEE